MTDRHVDPAGAEERVASIDDAARGEERVASIDAPTPAERSTVSNRPRDRGPSRADGPARDRGRRPWREVPVLVLIALVVAIVIRSFFVQAFYIPSPSMEPTLRQGDRVLVCRICYRLSDIRRGDVVVFSDPAPSPADRGAVGTFVRWLGEGIGLAQPQNEDFIKRVIGLPGDVVELRAGDLIVNGQPVQEPYLDPRSDSRSYGPVTVPAGDLFVLGDNRLVSGDSRLTPEEGGVGMVPEVNVIGKAFVIVWPPGRWGGI
jgi:signal peptidase I